MGKGARNPPRRREEQVVAQGRRATAGAAGARAEARFGVGEEEAECPERMEVARSSL